MRHCEKAGCPGLPPEIEGAKLVDKPRRSGGMLQHMSASSDNQDFF